MRGSLNIKKLMSIKEEEVGIKRDSVREFHVVVCVDVQGEDVSLLGMRVSCMLKDTLHLILH